MSHVVELVGPPGAGKSALVAALADRRLPGGGRIIPGRDLVMTPRSGFPLGIGRRFARPADPAIRRAALTARAPAWDDFLRHVLAGPGPVTGPAERLHGLVWTVTTLESLAVARSRSDASVVVLDEGPLQRVLTVAGEENAGLVRRHAELAPRTDLVLHLRVGVGPLLDRVRGRAASRVIGRHAGLDAAGLRAVLARDAAILDEVVTAAESAGRRVVRIDGEAPMAAVTAVALRAVADLVGVR